MPQSQFPPDDRGDRADLVQKFMELSHQLAEAQDEADVWRDKLTLITEQLGRQLKPLAGALVRGCGVSELTDVVRLDMTPHDLVLSLNGVPARLSKPEQNLIRSLASSRTADGAYAPIETSGMLRRLSSLEACEGLGIGTLRMRICRLRDALRQQGYGDMIRTLRKDGRTCYQLALPRQTRSS